MRAAAVTRIQRWLGMQSDTTLTSIIVCTQVGDGTDFCASLSCVGGRSGACHQQVSTAWAGRRVTCGVEATLPLRLLVLSSSSGTAAATPPDSAGRGGSGSTAAALTAVGLSNGGRSTAVATPSRGGTAEWSDSICVDEDETSDSRLCFELHEFGADAQNSSSSAVSLASASGTLSSTVLHQGCMALASIVGPGGYEVALSAVGDKIGSEAAAPFQTCDIHSQHLRFSFRHPVVPSFTLKCPHLHVLTCAEPFKDAVLSLHVPERIPPSPPPPNPPAPPPAPPVPPPGPPVLPPYLPPPQPPVSRVVERLNERFSTASASNNLAQAGVLLHQWDRTEECACTRAALLHTRIRAHTRTVFYPPSRVLHSHVRSFDAGSTAPGEAALCTLCTLVAPRGRATGRPRSSTM